MNTGRKRFPIEMRRGQDHGRPGAYLNLRTGVFLEHRGGLLPTNANDRLVRLPRPVVLVLGPATGGLYVLFLPLVGAVAGLYIVGRWAAGAAEAVGRAALLSLPVPAWVPGRASLLGFQARRRKAGRVSGQWADDELEKLAHEIEEKRKSQRTE